MITQIESDAEAKAQEDNSIISKAKIQAEAEQNAQAEA